MQNKVSILAIQETKSTEVVEGFDKALWGAGNFLCDTIDPVGQSGGLATIWDPAIFSQKRTVKLDGCLAIGGIWISSRKNCWLLNIYAPQELHRKEKLWSNILRLMEEVTDTWWIYFGDFNAVRSSEERLGSIFCHRTASRFNNFIHESGLVELNLGGRRFTYMSSDCGKHSKLDRFLVSPEMLNTWPDLKATVLNRLYSDHSPILLSTGVIDFGPYPFRFFNTWLSDPKLEELVSEIWGSGLAVTFPCNLSPVSALAGKLKQLKCKIREWRMVENDKNTKDSSELRKRIEKIDLQAELGQCSQESAKLRMEAIQKLKELEAIRILDLKQKSRVRWALEGDENSRYFHVIINRNIRVQRLNGLNIGGHWITDPGQIKDNIVKFFESKFMEPDPHRPRFICDKFRKLNEAQKEYLESPISLDEIKTAVWRCGANKAPGPDGYSIEFFRKFWDHVKTDMYMAVKHFEKTGVLNSGCNASFVTLVPKVPDPVGIADYRPISLIGIIYKVISNVLTERLKTVISSIISPEQTAFVRGRSILDGPLIANEILSWLKKSKRKALMLKVDFEKAFDCISWNFLDCVLEQMNFGLTWRSWIRGCLSSATVSVLLNGSPTKQFRVERGVRQGDPLAPFLFIIASEGLHCALESAIEKNIFAGLRLPSGGPTVSHLQYADDALFFGEWSIPNARNLIRILRCFELASGLKVNLNKSKIFGISCPPQETETVARAINCPIGAFPLCYLGLPIGVPMGRALYWTSIIEKFRSKLSGWKASSLSFGGRLTLCKSVLGTLGSYYFSLYKAPEKVLEEMERLRMQFFWGSNSSKRKVAWISWKKILAPRERGGLGVGSLKAQNMALMGKWWWKFKDPKQYLWKDVIRSIHGALGLLTGSVRNTSGCWGAIASLPSKLSKINLQFSEFFRVNQVNSGDNSISWELDRSRGYTVRSYSSYFDHCRLPEGGTRWGWNKLIPRKVNILAWRAMNYKLPTLANLNRIGVDVPLNCKVCNLEPENEDHVFTRCVIAKQVWNEIRKWWHCLGPDPITCIDLINSKKEFIGPEWLAETNEAICLISIWVIWTFRNKGIFRKEIKTDLELAAEIKILAHLWINARKTKGRKLTWDRWVIDPVLELCHSVS